VNVPPVFIVDKSHLAVSIPEEADPGARGSDDLGECFLAHFRDHGLGLALLAEVRQQEPDFSEMFLMHVLSRNIRFEADLVDHLFNSSEKRLARVLLLLANFGKAGEPQTVIPKINQETLAEIIGTTRSRVSFSMNRFRKMGFIDYNAGLEVHSSLLNVVLHDWLTCNRSRRRLEMAGTSLRWTPGLTSKAA